MTTTYSNQDWVSKTFISNDNNGDLDFSKLVDDNIKKSKNKIKRIISDYENIKNIFLKFSKKGCPHYLNLSNHNAKKKKSRRINKQNCLELKQQKESEKTKVLAELFNFAKTKSTSKLNKLTKKQLENKRFIKANSYIKLLMDIINICKKTGYSYSNSNYSYDKLIQDFVQQNKSSSTKEQYAKAYIINLIKNSNIDEFKEVFVLLHDKHKDKLIQLINTWTCEAK
jgi:hypothetical protein